MKNALVSPGSAREPVPPELRKQIEAELKALKGVLFQPVPFVPKGGVRRPRCGKCGGSVGLSGSGVRRMKCLSCGALYHERRLA